jgi:tetratricopeptide (TPR) repeat protein
MDLNKNKAVFSEASALHREGKLQLASQKYISLLDDKEFGFLAALNLGKIYREFKEYDKAYEMFLLAYEKKKDPEVLFHIGEVLYLERKEDDAKEFLIRFLNDTSDGYYALYILGMIEYKRGNFKEAIKYFESALHKKYSEDCLFFLGKACFFNGTIERAYEIFKQLIEKNSDNHYYNQFYGLVLLELDRYDDAVVYLERALLNDPNYDKYKDFLQSLTYENKVKEYAKMEPKVVEIEEKIKKKEASFYDVLNLGFYYYFSEDYGKAMEIFSYAKNEFSSLRRAV